MGYAPTDPQLHFVTPKAPAAAETTCPDPCERVDISQRNCFTLVFSERRCQPKPEPEGSRLSVGIMLLLSLSSCSIGSFCKSSQAS